MTYDANQGINKRSKQSKSQGEKETNKQTREKNTKLKERKKEI